MVASRWAEKKENKEVSEDAVQTAAFRSAISKELFDNLPKGERDGYLQRAVAEAKAAKQLYEDMLMEDPSKRPEDRQM